MITIKLWPDLLKRNNSLPHCNSSPDQRHTGYGMEQKTELREVWEDEFFLLWLDVKQFLCPFNHSFPHEEKGTQEITAQKPTFILQLVDASWDRHCTWLWQVEGGRLRLHKPLEFLSGGNQMELEYRRDIFSSSQGHLRPLFVSNMLRNRLQYLATPEHTQHYGCWCWVQLL